MSSSFSKTAIQREGTSSILDLKKYAFFFSEKFWMTVFIIFFPECSAAYKMFQKSKQMKISWC